MATIHNFILYHEPLDEVEAPAEFAGGQIVGDSLDLDHCVSSEEAQVEDDDVGDARRERIATEMWADYAAL